MARRKAGTGTDSPLATIGKDGIVTAAYAQRHFREVRGLLDQGPVRITVHGKIEMVILSRKDYEKMTGRSVRSMARRPASG